MRKNIIRRIYIEEYNPTYIYLHNQNHEENNPLFECEGERCFEAINRAILSFSSASYTRSRF